jgi:hypothetical protein
MLVVEVGLAPDRAHSKFCTPTTLLRMVEVAYPSRIAAFDWTSKAAGVDECAGGRSVHFE